MCYNEGIENAVRASGIANGCMTKQESHLMRKYTPEQWINVFWSHVNKDGSIPAHCPELGQCWEWTASHHRQGYGNYTYQGKYILCHRLSWILTNGEIPDGLCVLHKCDNTSCVNPDHLSLGTQLVNIQDKVNKGRQSKLSGEKHHSCIISDAKVEAIRQRYAEGGVLYKDIAKEFSVSIASVGKFVTKRHTKR